MTRKKESDLIIQEGPTGNTILTVLNYLPRYHPKIGWLISFEETGYDKYFNESSFLPVELMTDEQLEKELEETFELVNV